MRLIYRPETYICGPCCDVKLEYAILEVSGSRHYPEISLLPKEKMKAEEKWRSEKKRRRRTRRRRRRRANKRKDRFTRYDFCRIQLPYDTLTTLFRPRLSQGFKICFKILRLFFRVSKRVVRRLHATKSYRVR